MRKPSRVKLEKKEKNQLRNAIGSANLFNFNFFLLRQWLERGKKGKKAKPSQNISKGNNSVENKKKLIIDWGPKFCSLSQQKCAGRAGDVLGLFPSTGLLYLWPRRLREMLSAGALFLSEVIFRKFTCDDEANAKRLSFFPSPRSLMNGKIKNDENFLFFSSVGTSRMGRRGWRRKCEWGRIEHKKWEPFMLNLFFMLGLPEISPSPLLARTSGWRLRANSTRLLSEIVISFSWTFFRKKSHWIFFIT